MFDPLLTRIRQYAARHDLLPPGEGVLAMVSGGADSLLLMHALREIHDGPIGVLTIDHGLRPEAAAEVAAVTAAATALGIPVWTERLRLESGPSVQERARDARRTVGRATAADHGFEHIATGHTASDQAETVLFRIARGTGRTGAVGIAARSGSWVRPLLCVTADEARRWCRAQGLRAVDDPSNLDRRYARTRVRHDLLGALEAVHPGATLAAARFADQLRDEAAVLEPLVDDAWRRCATGDGLLTRALLGEPRALARLLVRRFLAGGGVSPDATWVDRVLAAAAAGGGRFDAPGGSVQVDEDTVTLPQERSLPEPAALDVPGRVVFGNRVVAARVGPATLPRADRVAVRVTGPLVVRGPQPGDRLAIAGGGHHHVGKLLAGAGVPAGRRRSVPVVSCGDRVVWVAGYRADPNLLAPLDADATVLEVCDQ